MLCASFVVQSILQWLFCVNASVPQASVFKSFCAQSFFCARDFSLTVRDFWCAEQLRWVETSFEEMRKVDQCSDEMKTVEKNLLRWHVRRDGMRWEELTWGEKSSMIWDEIKCGVRSASVKCEARGVKSTVWSVKKVFAWRCIAPGSRAGHVLGQQHCNSFAQSTHARAWLAHGACKFYRWERSYSISLRQLPPRLVRVLLVCYMAGLWHCFINMPFLPKKMNGKIRFSIIGAARIQQRFLETAEPSPFPDALQSWPLKPHSGTVHKV